MSLTHRSPNGAALDEGGAARATRSIRPISVSIASSGPSPGGTRCWPRPPAARAPPEEEAALLLSAQTSVENRGAAQAVRQMRLARAAAGGGLEPRCRSATSGRKVANNSSVTPSRGLSPRGSSCGRAGGVWVRRQRRRSTRETRGIQSGLLRVPAGRTRASPSTGLGSPPRRRLATTRLLQRGPVPAPPCPSCHRPLFREDWAQYPARSTRIRGLTVAGEIAGTYSPIVLIQDYHFALLPGLFKRDAPARAHRHLLHIPCRTFDPSRSLPGRTSCPAGGCCLADIIASTPSNYWQQLLPGQRWSARI